MKLCEYFLKYNPMAISMNVKTNFVIVGAILKWFPNKCHNHVDSPEVNGLWEERSLSQTVT